MAGWLKSIDEGLVEKYSVVCPYYTSYPTLSEWSYDFTSRDFVAGLKNLCAEGGEVPVLLYIHFPFCKKRCYFCICNSVITRGQEKIREFLSHLFREIDLLNMFFEKHSYSLNVKRIHLGGGSPSFMGIEEFGMLVGKLKTMVDFNNLDEFAVEVDSGTITREKLVCYYEKGVDRISFGIQDFDTKVQKAVNRVHSPELVEDLLPPGIRRRFKGVNFDLLYGLPLQSRESFGKTIEIVKKLSPDRITLLKYAHVPDRRRHQKLIKESDLPDNFERTRIFAEAVCSLTDGGYEFIGIDHFARPTGGLVAGVRNGTLWRSFNGFADGGMHCIVGIGPTSTHGFINYYAQNVYSLEEYYKCIDNREFPILRGYELSKDDLIRRDVINEILCYHILDCSEIEHKHSIDFGEYFRQEIESLGCLIRDGMLDVSNGKITVTELGRIFIPHVCRVFDNYLHAGRMYKITGP